MLAMDKAPVDYSCIALFFILKYIRLRRSGY
jgi:hypothetical protein